jgi:prepilin-type N-terminal cleavage/methylation domain-containing protein
MQTKPAHSKLTSAYTFIEILVALTIVGLIFGIGYVSFRDFSRRQALNGTARSIIGDLRLAQEQAISGRKPADLFCNFPNSLDGYFFRVVSPQNYVIEASCSGGEVEAKNVTIPSDVSMSVPVPNPILFKSVAQGTDISGASATITLTQAGTINSRAITISAAGEIK